MQSKRPVFLMLFVSVLIIMCAGGCGPSSQTAVATQTSLPISITPSLVPSLAAVQIADLSTVVINIKDLPGSYQEAPQEYVELFFDGMRKAIPYPFVSEFGFWVSSKFELFGGNTVYLQTKTQQTEFVPKIRTAFELPTPTPEQRFEKLNLRLHGEEMVSKKVCQPVNKLDVCAIVVVFRRDRYGVVMYMIHLAKYDPSIDLDEYADILDTRLSIAINSAK